MTDKHQLIAAEIPRLRRYARALVGDHAAADDLVQDCVERALSRLHLWRQGGSPRAWLFTILRNLHVSGRRQAARRPPTASFDDDGGPQIETPPRQGHRLLVRDLARALDLLVDEQREVVLLVGLEEMTYQETADILGIPIGTVMSRLSRGRENLRRLMEGNGEDDRPSLRRVK